MEYNIENVKKYYDDFRLYNYRSATLSWTEKLRASRINTS